MVARSRSSSAASTGGGTSGGWAPAPRVWSTEGMLLMIGLSGVFILGVMMSSHVHIMDPPHGPVAYERQLHSTTAKAPRLKASWLEDYIQSREALMRLVQAGQEIEAAGGDLNKLSLRDLIKRVLGHEVDGLGEPIDHPDPGIHAESFESQPKAALDAAGLRRPKAKAEGSARRASKKTNDGSGASASSPKLRAGKGADEPLVVKKSRATTMRGEGSAVSAVTTTKLPRWKRNLRHAPLLLICHNRADFLDRTLSAIFKYHPGDGVVPIVISEDGSHPKMAIIIEKHRALFQAKYPNLVFLHINHQQDPTAPTGYHKLAQHYKWALSQAFDHLHERDPRVTKVDKVMVLEEDLEIAPDFFNFFGALAPLLDTDPTLLAISAWNDNGMANRVRDTTALYRSDFFPGLGWMLPRRVWEELEPKWPKGYWDDWLREPPQRKDRQVIRPEVCRTYHFGNKGGTSEGEYSDYLRAVRLNDQPVAFDAMDLSALQPQNYEREFLAGVHAARPVSVRELVDEKEGLPESVRITYDSLSDGPNSFEEVARRVGVMDNIKARVPRGAYQGIVTCWHGNTKVYLVPAQPMY